MPWSTHLAVSSLQHSLSSESVPWPRSGLVTHATEQWEQVYLNFVLHLSLVLHDLLQVLEQADGDLTQMAELLVGRSTAGL